MPATRLKPPKKVPDGLMLGGAIPSPTQCCYLPMTYIATIGRGLKSLAQIVSERTVDGVTTTDVRYYVSSLTGNAEEVMLAVRSHWKIENSLHWSLDVSFREDESRVRLGHAQENFSLVRKLALGLLKHETTARIGVAAKRMKAGWDEHYLCQVLQVNKKHN